MTHGIYVHVPWCRVHCPYCAFDVRIARAPAWKDWLGGVLRDHAAFADAVEGPAETVYLGGGTPSLVPIDVLEALLAALPRAPGAELTLEVDPGTLDADGLLARLALGIDRLSVGVQSFHPAHARRLGRGHGPRHARALLAEVVDLPLRSWSLDLMFALPGQTLAELDADIDELLDWAPPHVSLYGLTYEPGTPFDRLRQRGRLVEAAPELWRAMYDRIVDRLQAGGWERYEVSNFARPGHRSRHNEATWRGRHYLGCGPGAHGYLPPGPRAPWGRRTINATGVEPWLHQPGPEVEVLDARTAALDLLLSTLRHTDGVPLAELARLGLSLSERALTPLIEGRLITLSPTDVRLTPQGFAVADGITAALADGLEPG